MSFRFINLIHISCGRKNIKIDVRNKTDKELEKFISELQYDKHKFTLTRER